MSNLYELSEQIKHLEAERAVAWLRLSSIDAQISSAKKRRTQICAHENLRTEKRYHEGTYYDRSYSEVITTCLDCGHVVDTKKTEVGFYG